VRSPASPPQKVSDTSFSGDSEYPKVVRHLVGASGSATAFGAWAELGEAGGCQSPRGASWRRPRRSRSAPRKGAAGGTGPGPGADARRTCLADPSDSSKWTDGTGTSGCSTWNEGRDTQKVSSA